MRRHTVLGLSILVLGWTSVVAAPSMAATFTKAPIAPELGLDALDRGVARAQVGRDLFANPYATVTICNVDVYDRFPYVESRRFQVVSDPRWNRLVVGEPGRSLAAYDGKGRPFGPLSEPRGLAVDETNHLYVADAGNRRVLVLKATTEYGDVRLEPVSAIDGFGSPYDVAWSDGGTPFASGDDVLYVADAGRNRVVAVALGGGAARTVASLGDLGSGAGRFAGPMAVAVGRSGGVNTRDVYVADAHNRRIVHLRHEPAGLAWVAEAAQSADILTSLDTDAWGNVYAAAPRQGVVRKFSPALAPVAELRGGLAQPKDFHVPFVQVRDHRDGRVSRVGQANGVTVEDWTDASGIALWSLGLEVEGLSVAGGAGASARFTLTDRADVSLEIMDMASGRSLSRRALGPLAAGAHEVALVADDVRGATGAGDLVLRLTAGSSYPGSTPRLVTASFRPDGGQVVLPSRPMLLGNKPNPVAASTRIAFLLPASAAGDAALRVFDATGRRVKSFETAFAPGLNEIVWDGRDDRGARVKAGVYFYRLEVGEERFARTLVVAR